MAATLTNLDNLVGSGFDDRKPTAGNIQRLGTTVPSGDPFRGLTDELQSAPATGNPVSMVRARIRASLGPEYDNLVTERNTLVYKEFEGELSSTEASRLSFLRWQLDRIEDALEGDGLDYLESLVEQQELLADRIREFEDKLRGVSSSVFTPRNSRRR